MCTEYIHQFTHTALIDQSPVYISELIALYERPKQLRQRDPLSLKVPATKKLVGKQSFEFAAALVWNDIPFIVRQSDNLVSFKRNLKTYLFNEF